MGQWNNNGGCEGSLNRSFATVLKTQSSLICQNITSNITDPKTNKVQSSFRKRKPSALEGFFTFVHHVGIAPQKFVAGSRSKTWLKLIQFLLFASLASIYAGISLKRTLLHSIEISGETDVGLYIGVGRCFTQIALQLFFASSLYFYADKFTKMLDILDSSSFSKVSHKSWAYYFGWSTGFFGAFRAFYSTFLVIPTHPGGNLDWASHWNWLLHYRSREINVTLVSHNYHDYWENLHVIGNVGALPTETLALGILGCSIKLTNHALNHFGRDAILLAVFTLWIMARQFQPTELKTVNPGESFGATVLGQYKDLKIISDAINKRLGGITQVLLLDNILLLADFLDGFLNPRRIAIQKVAMAVDVTKMMITYIMAATVASKITKFRNWLRVESHQHQMGMSRREVRWISEEISTNPVGIGSDATFINKRFLVHYFGIAIAYFFTMVETRSQIPGCDCGDKSDK